MSESDFRVQQIDHVELIVPDQYQAAEWYRQVFGLRIMEDFEFWAADGPLMISSDGGHTKLALFKGDAPGFSRPVGFQRVAFHVDGQGLLTFLDRLAKHPVFDHDGRKVYELDVVDHDLSYSLYFCDPYGNRYEVTTYEYETVRSLLNN